MGLRSIHDNDKRLQFQAICGVIMMENQGEKEKGRLKSQSFRILTYRELNMTFADAFGKPF